MDCQQYSNSFQDNNIDFTLDKHESSKQEVNTQESASLCLASKRWQDTLYRAVKCSKVTNEVQCCNTGLKREWKRSCSLPWQFWVFTKPIISKTQMLNDAYAFKEVVMWEKKKSKKKKQ